MFLANKERVETYFEIIGYQERIQGYVCTCVCVIYLTSFHFAKYFDDFHFKYSFILVHWFLSGNYSLVA